VTGVDAVQGYNSLLTNRWISSVLENPRPQNVIRLFAAEAVVAAPYDPYLATYGDTGYPLEAGFLVVPVKDPVPRAVCADRWRMSPADETTTAVRAEGFDPRRELLLEPVSGENDPESGHRNSPASRCEVTYYSQERVTLEVEQAEAAPVALLDSYFSGWTAEVNGRKTAIFPAWGIHRAVQAPAGRSTVEFTYRTPGLRAGMVVSLVAVLSVLLWAAFPFRHEAETAVETV
jgi:hypothetical protein